MSDNDTIAVIIAAYNAEKTLVRAIESSVIDEQVAQILVVDDCSIDRTMDIALRYETLHDKVEVYSTGVSSAPSKNRNSVLKYCCYNLVTLFYSESFIEKWDYKKLLANSLGYQLVGNVQYSITKKKSLGKKIKMEEGSRFFPCKVMLFEYNVSIKGVRCQDLGFIRMFIKHFHKLKFYIDCNRLVCLFGSCMLFFKFLTLCVKFKTIKYSCHAVTEITNSLLSKYYIFNLILMRGCDYRITSHLPVSNDDRRFLKLDVNRINFKKTWGLLYSSLREVKLFLNLMVVVRMLISIDYILDKSKSEFIKHFIQRVAN